MARLEQLFASKVRAEIFRLLFGLGRPALHVREIARCADLAFATVQHDLKQLLLTRLITETRDGCRVYYRANHEHHLYPHLHAMVIQASGPVPILRKALLHEDLDFAFIFRVDPVIDLFIVGRSKSRRLDGKLHLAAQKIDQPLNSFFYSREEFKTQSVVRAGFVRSLMEEPRIFVLGNEELLR